MNLFDIVGPVMVGPSSSHTAGAVRIGYVARKLLAEPVAKAENFIIWFFSGNRSGTWNKTGDCGGTSGNVPG